VRYGGEQDPVRVSNDDTEKVVGGLTIKMPDLTVSAYHPGYEGKNK
jgi:hypothetical protein